MQDKELRILLVGGDQQSYDRVSNRLDSLHARRSPVLWCNDHSLALGLIDVADYDVILVDALHCVDSACEWLEDARAQGYEPPMIALIDHHASALGQRMLEAGANDFIAALDLQAYMWLRTIHYVVDRYEAEQKLIQLNYFDSLTGIPNRQQFLQNLTQAVARAGQNNSILALLVINLDGFKQFNESYGLAVGDELVTTMAERLNQCLRKSDSIARVGGDEFTLIMDDANSPEDVALVSKKVAEVLSKPIMLDGYPKTISCSIGVAIYPDDGDSLDGLIKSANIALLKAKRTLGSKVCLYSDVEDRLEMAEGELEAELRRGLRNREFELHYQPRVNLVSGKTVGMESLIRWRHPDRGLVMPEIFIGTAEKSGLIIPMGYWIIEQACEDLKGFDARGCDPLHISVNLSFEQILDPLFVVTTTQIIQQSGIDPTRLEFELTETAMIADFEKTVESMKALGQLGVSFSLDDFGTGFSSFSHIQQLPISALKVDRSFISSVTNGEEDAIIVKSMIGLAHSLHLQIIAEGVETVDQAHFLWQNDCDQVQGYYFSPALTAQDFSAMAHEQMAVV
jgi:diguanylate cyclase (GGDEF)-like protein